MEQSSCPDTPDRAWTQTRSIMRWLFYVLSCGQFATHTGNWHRWQPAGGLRGGVGLTYLTRLPCPLSLSSECHTSFLGLRGSRLPFGIPVGHLVLSLGFPHGPSLLVSPPRGCDGDPTVSSVESAALVASNASHVVLSCTWFQAGAVPRPREGLALTAPAQRSPRGWGDSGAHRLLLAGG